MPLSQGQATILPDLYAPTGYTYSTFPRLGWSNASLTPTSGTLQMTAIALPANFRVGHLAVICSSVAAASPTNWWYALYDQNRVQLAITANQLTAAFAASGIRPLAVATTAAGASTGFTTTYTGIYYFGFMMTATTMPGIPQTTSTLAVTTAAPVLGGTSNTAMTTPPGFPTTATALTSTNAMMYATVGV